MSSVELPVLTESKCTQCFECIEVCPTGCLEAGRFPWLARPADCTSCGACAMICPEDALELMPVASPGAGK